MRKITSFLLVFTLVLGGIFATQENANAFSGEGIGLDYSPFTIVTCEQLQEIQLDTEGYYILGDDIDCSDSSTWNSGAGFDPIDSFSGILDGRNYTINGLSIDRPDSTDNIGVFGNNTAGTIKNVKLTNLNVSATVAGTEYVGGFVGTTNGATIEDVHVSGTVTGSSVVGGFVGYLAGNSTVARSSFTGDSSDIQSYGGGFAGFIYNASITDSYASGTYVGGNVGGGFAARVIAEDTTVTISNSYFVGTVENSNYRAGFASGLEEYGTGEVIITDSYVVAPGTPDGVTPQATRPFAQKTGTPTVTNFYYDADEAGIEDCGASIVTCTAVNTDGLSPDYFKNTSEVAPLTEWDFTDVWQTTIAYPTLQESSLNPIGVVFAGGTGQLLDPYLIETCEQLQAMRQDLDAFYVLNIDINCTDTENWNGFKGFDPVGDSTYPFTGQLDGNDKTITGLYIDRADDILGEDVNDEEYVGLFGYVDDGAVVNMNMVDTYVKGYRHVGGVAGYTDNTNLSNLNVNLTTVDNSCDPGDCIWARWGSYGGGIVGTATNATILANVHTGGPVKGSGNYIGGIVGDLADSQISGSSSISNVDGGYQIGGIAGAVYGSTITDTYATGSVIGTTENGKTGTNVGGFAGSIFSSIVQDSYATGDVEGDGDYIGGFAGSTGCSSEFTSVYSEGDVSGSLYVGGFSGSDGCMGPGSDFFDVYTTGDVTGTSGNVGGLIGQAYQTEVYGGYSTGSISGGGNFVGGIFGFAGGTGISDEDADITVLSDVYATGNVHGDANSVGGLIGSTESYGDLGVLIDQSFSQGDVSGTQYVGGLVGNMIGGRFDEVYASGNVTGETFNIGGAIGQMLLGGISNSYARGNVEAGDAYVGGYIGALYGGSIERAYSSGNVTIPESGSERAGGFAGEVYIDSGDIELFDNFTVSTVSAPAGEGGFIANYNSNGVAMDNNYFDITKTGVADCTAVSGAITGCAGVNADGTDNDYFMNNTSNAPFQEWDFASDLWQTQDEDYPCFMWQNETDYPCGIVESDEDLNGDGTPDSDQPHVGGYVSPITGKLVAMDMGEGCELTTDDIVEESDNTVQDPAYVYENGLFDFEADCTELGYTTTIQLFYYDVDKEDLIARKYNPNTNAYFNLEGEFGAVVEERTINGQNVTVVMYELTDGGDLDMDLVEDGNISDPAGLASSVLGSPNTGLKPVY